MVLFETRRRSRYLAQLRRAVGGRSIVLTGASSGIGRAFARHAAAAGAKLAVVARREEELLRVREEVEAQGGSALVFSYDLGDRDQVASLVADLHLQFGAADVLINNAAISLRRSVENSLERSDDFRRLMEVNFLGPLALTLGLLPSMLARGHGHIVNVSTIGAQTGAPNFSAYVASKAAMDHFTRAFGLELGRRPLALTTLYMPLVSTPMLTPTGLYDRWPALRTEVAARRIGWALIRRPARVAPRWTIGVELLQVLAPGLMRAAFGRYHDPVHRWLGRRKP